MYNVHKYHEVTDSVVVFKDVTWEFVCNTLNLVTPSAIQGALNAFNYHGRLLVTLDNGGGNITVTGAL